MRLITNDRNMLRDAILSATGIKPSRVMYRTSMARAGGGLVKLTGDYTGQHDATFEVEITSDTISGDPQTSAPIFTGVGNGAMTAVAASSGVAAQRVDVTLINLGTETRSAYTPFQGVTLRAKTAGSGGNSITIAVNQGTIARAATQHSLLTALSAGSNEYIGDEWDFGHAVLNPDGTIPSTAPRIAFGSDPQVYRAYKEYLDGRYVYRFNPAPVRDVQAGERVYSVTGARTVTVTNGVTTNTYTAVTTLYSLLSQIQGDAAALVEVVEPVTVDMAPDGMAITEMSVRTTSYLASQEREGTQFAKDADIGLVVGASAPTESLVIRCKNADMPGAEIWDVAGTVSLSLASAVTGVPYDGTNYDFTIPVALPPAVTPSANLLARLDLLQRTGGQDLPSLCYRDLVAGAEARSRTFTFVWARRPGDTCECDTSGIVGGPDPGDLGTNDDGGDVVPQIDPGIQARIESLYDWAATFAASNSELVAANTTVDTDIDTPDGQVTTGFAETTDTWIRERVSAVLKVDRVDIEAANKAVAMFAKTLQSLDSELEHSIPTDALTAWDDAVTDMQTQFAVIDSNEGASWWRDFGTLIKDDSATAGVDNNPALAANGPKLLTRVFDAYLERYRTALRAVSVKAGIWPDFEGAGRLGNDVWQDQGGDFWWESRDGLLPIQNGFYYHSCKLAPNTDGDLVPTSTREFGIGVQIGCPDNLREGDQLIIELNIDGNLRATYQVGDTFTATIIRAAAVPFGGGQTGDDLLTWRVVGSTLGALAEYELDRTAPVAYSDSGIEFLITPGGVPFALGDVFSFSVEGGEFRWRKDGGSWTTTDIAPTVALSDGVSAVFDPGAAPSFIAGDLFNFAAEAINGPDRAITLRDGALRGSAGTRYLTITPSAASAVSGVYIGRHTLTASDTIVLQGSNASDFGSIAATQTITTQAGRDIWAEFTPTASLAYWRLVITAAADWEIGWVWISDDPLTPACAVDATVTNVWKMTSRRWRLPTRRRALGLGARIRLEALGATSVQEIIDALEDAALSEDGRIALVANGAGEPRTNEIVTVNADTIEITDEFDFEPASPGVRWQTIELELQPAA